LFCGSDKSEVGRDEHFTLIPFEEDNVPARNLKRRLSFRMKILMIAEADGFGLSVPAAGSTGSEKVAES